MFFYNSVMLKLRGFSDSFCQCALKVCSLIFMDNAFFSQLVDFAQNTRKILFCGSGVCSGFKITHSVTGSFCLVTVLLSALCSLTGIFLCSLVICHFGKKLI